jgi:hypothetical protein
MSPTRTRRTGVEPISRSLLRRGVALGLVALVGLNGCLTPTVWRDSEPLSEPTFHAGIEPDGNFGHRLGWKARLWASGSRHGHSPLPEAPSGCDAVVVVVRASSQTEPSALPPDAERMTPVPVYSAETADRLSSQSRDSCAALLYSLRSEDSGAVSLLLELPGDSAQLLDRREPRTDRNPEVWVLLPLAATGDAILVPLWVASLPIVFVYLMFFLRY